jgi:hypothetical protein
MSKKIGKKIGLTLCALFVCASVSAQKELCTYYYACAVSLNNHEAWVTPVKSAAIYQYKNQDLWQIIKMRLEVQFDEFIRAEVNKNFTSGMKITVFVHKSEEVVTKFIRDHTATLRKNDKEILHTHYFKYVLSESEKSRE